MSAAYGAAALRAVDEHADIVTLATPEKERRLRAAAASPDQKGAGYEPQRLRDVAHTRLPKGVAVEDLGGGDSAADGR